MERRKRVRLQAKLRGEWEKSRHERLLELTRALQELESMPEEHQKEVLTNLQLEKESGSLPVLKEEEATLVDVPVVLLPSQSSTLDAPALSHLGDALTATPTTVEPNPPAEKPSELTKIDISVDTAGDVSITESHKPAAAPGKPAAHSEPSDTAANDVELAETNGVHPVDGTALVKKDIAEKALPPVEVDVKPTSGLDNQTTTPSESSETPSSPSPTKRPHDPNSDGLALDPGSPGDPAATKGESIPTAPVPDLTVSSDDMAKPKIADTSTGDHPTLIKPDKASDRMYFYEHCLTRIWEQMESLDLSPGPEASKHLSSLILDLHNHYIKTSTIGSNGFISALTEDSSSLDTPDVPISKVQLKFTQAESELWKEIVTVSSDTQVDVARFSELVQQFASVELPTEELAEQEAAVEETEEDPMSERSAQLEEQSSRMVSSLLRRSNAPTGATYAESRLILEAMGVPCIQSSIPFEAEALASSLVLNGLADFVGSEDTVCHSIFNT